MRSVAGLPKCGLMIQEVRKLIARDKLLAVGRNLSISLSDNETDTAWTYGAEPLLDVPISKIIDHFDYSVQLTYVDKAKGYNAEIILTGRRSFSSEQVWVSFARTTSALDSEYKEGECVGRELVSISEAEWDSFCTDSPASVGLKVGKDNVPVVGSWTHFGMSATLAPGISAAMRTNSAYGTRFHPLLPPGASRCTWRRIIAAAPRTSNSHSWT